MTGLNLTWIVVLLGLLTTGYTLSGGIRAVVWTDVKQMSVIIGGLLISLGILLYHVLGQLDFWQALNVLGASGKLNAVEAAPDSWNLIPALKGSDLPRTFWEDRYNLWSGLFGGLFLMLSYFGCDQIQVQRYLTVESANASRKSLLVSAFAKIPMQVLVLFLGALLYLFNLLGAPPLLYNPSDRETAQSVADQSRMEELEESYRQALSTRRELALQIADEDAPRGKLAPLGKLPGIGAKGRPASGRSPDRSRGPRGYQLRLSSLHSQSPPPRYSGIDSCSHFRRCHVQRRLGFEFPFRLLGDRHLSPLDPAPGQPTTVIDNGTDRDRFLGRWSPPWPRCSFRAEAR